MAQCEGAAPGTLAAMGIDVAPCAQASLTSRLSFLTASRAPPRLAASLGSRSSHRADAASPAGLPGYATFYDLGEVSFRADGGGQTGCGEAICSRQGQVSAPFVRGVWAAENSPGCVLHPFLMQAGEWATPRRPPNRIGAITCAGSLCYFRACR